MALQPMAELKPVASLTGRLALLASEYVPTIRRGGPLRRQQLASAESSNINVCPRPAWGFLEWSTLGQVPPDHAPQSRIISTAFYPSPSSENNDFQPDTVLCYHDLIDDASLHRHLRPVRSGRSGCAIPDDRADARSKLLSLSLSRSKGRRDHITDDSPNLELRALRL